MPRPLCLADVITHTAALSTTTSSFFSSVQTDGVAKLLHEFNVKDVTGKHAIRELSQVQVVDQTRSMLLRTPQYVLLARVPPSTSPSLTTASRNAAGSATCSTIWTPSRARR